VARVVTSHQRLQNLSDVWEKEIVDERSIQTLLDDLKGGQPPGRAGPSSFHGEIRYRDARQTLATFFEELR